MSIIMLDAALARKLNALNQPAHLCDPSGHVVGTFVPSLALSEWEPVTPEISPEELERRSKSNEKHYTTTEVLAHLEKL